ncbi:MAG: alpha-amylase family glycosyl hydrolase, partial [Pseudomonadota bacterium]
MRVVTGDKSGRETAEWWRGAVIYQIYPRSFRDTNADGIGDLNGIAEGLDYIASLGVDGIWISPFFTSPMKDFGYDVSDYCGIDPSYGTFEDFDRVIERAHALGLKVIIDQVYSHTSDEHAWFKESRADRLNAKADWYVWADPKPDGSPPSNWQSVFGGSAWQWDGPRKQYFLHNFLTSQPDLNVHNPEVQAAVLDVMRFWLDRGVDGFRLDALNFSMHDPQLRDNPPSNAPIEAVTRPFDMQIKKYNQSHDDIPAFLERLRGVLNEYDGRFTVAEVGGPDPLAEMKAFTEGGKRLDSAYNFDFLYAPDLTADRVRASLLHWDGTPDEGWPSWAFSNHDAPRAVTRWSNGEDFDQIARLSMLLLLSLRGNPIIYQGEELGLPQGFVAFEDLLDPEAIANWPHTLGRD